MELFGTNIGRKRFCHELYNLFELKEYNETIESSTSKPSYVVETIRTFLKHDENFYALELVDRIEEILHAHLEDCTRDSIPMAIIFLLITKKETFLLANDPKIKQVFGPCPFNTLQELVVYATKLKMELSDDCVTYIFKNKLKLCTDLWKNVSHETKPINKQQISPIKQIFYLQSTKREEKKQEVKPPTTSFSMTYTPPNDLEKYSLKTYYEKYSNNLSGFTPEEFCKSMQQILSSNKSSAELQNELFEMLGFEVFELISELLDNRYKILEEDKNVENTTSVPGYDWKSSKFLYNNP